MTCLERQQCYEQQQAYRQRREEFNEEVARWFAEKYQPKVPVTK